ncbi:hypothetical protein P8452_37918 [Trifolium repens]|nr:hypothetical protein P8452_37918 [Trifolium repens]
MVLTCEVEGLKGEDGDSYMQPKCLIKCPKGFSSTKASPVNTKLKFEARVLLKQAKKLKFVSVFLLEEKKIYTYRVYVIGKDKDC